MRSEAPKRHLWQGFYPGRDNINSAAAHSPESETLIKFKAPIQYHNDSK